MRKTNGTGVEENTAVVTEQEVVETTEKEQDKIVAEEETSQVPTDEEPKVTEKPNTGKVANSRYVPLRERPSANANVVTVMKTGDSADILDRVTGFYKIKISDGRVGFVSSTYFRED